MKIKKYVDAYELGQKVTYDIVEPRKRKKIVTIIDYFTRRAWAKLIGKITEENILKVLIKVYNKVYLKGIYRTNPEKSGQQN